MTHWKDITSSTTQFTDKSYMDLYTPPEFMLTPEQQRAQIEEAERRKKEKDAKTR